METSRIEMDRLEALRLYREYRKHQHYAAPIDHEIQRTYKMISQGRVVIRALESIINAGFDDAGFPKLAISHAVEKKVRFFRWHNGSMRFGPGAWPRGNASKAKWFEWPENTVPHIRNRLDGEAIVPLIPVHLRPKRGLANYHILWEAEWRRLPPVDPLLIRRLGKGDLWVVVAAWDLTEVERAAIAARMSS